MPKINCRFDGTFSKVTVRYIGTIVCKVDTGAAYTIMGLDMFSALTGIDKRKALEFISNVKCSKRAFKSYSGNVFNAMLCRLRNVKIESIVIPEFYFYVTSTDVNGYGLLGMNFIKNCKVDGNPNCGFILEKLYDDSYDSSEFIELDDLVISENSNFNDAMSILSMSNKSSICK